MITHPKRFATPLSIRAPVDQKPLFAGIAHFHGPPVSHPAALATAAPRMWNGRAPRHHFVAGKKRYPGNIPLGRRFRNSVCRAGMGPVVTLFGRTPCRDE